MAKRYELSIKASYLPGWTIYEGCRELIQNARDSEVQFGAKMSVDFKMRKRDGADVGAIVITNTDTVMPREVLLIGHTTKEDDRRLIGKFGEGLKYGIMALLRMGIEVKIRNGSEVWNPKIDWSDNFNAQVLMVEVSSGHKDENRVSFEIVGISENDWLNVKSKLLFLDDYPSHIETPSGKILRGPERAGQIFVKGMFVAKTDYKFGYDFNDGDIDRDRRMISDLDSKCGEVLAEAVNKGMLAKSVYWMMRENVKEASYVSQYRLDGNGRKAIVEAFKEDCPDAIAVETMEQARELETYGKRGVQVGWNLRGIVEADCEPIHKVIGRLRNSAHRGYNLDELDADEIANLKLAVNLVAKARAAIYDRPLDISQVNIVDFATQDLLGTYNTSTGQINLARKILKNKAKTLYTLVHEAAHNHGDDGFMTHDAAISDLMQTILNDIL